MKNSYSSPKYYIALLVILVAIATILGLYLYITINPNNNGQKTYVVTSTTQSFFNQKSVKKVPDSYKFSSSKLEDTISIPLDLKNIEVSKKCDINIYDYFNDKYHTPKQAFSNGQFIRITNEYELNMQDESKIKTISMKNLKVQDNLANVNKVKDIDIYIREIEKKAFARYKEIFEIENPECASSFSETNFDYSFSFGKGIGMEIGLGTKDNWNILSITLYQKYDSYKFLDEFTVLGLYTFDSYGNLYNEYYPYFSKNVYEFQPTTNFESNNSTFVLKDIIRDSITASDNSSIPNEMNISSYEFIYMMSNGKIKPFLKIDADYTSLFYELK
ncbi:hypothetical protein IPJ91_01870 [bacterium]|nr:MAG: hypothetical protein IPJ91_01870 [bacterium]